MTKDNVTGKNKDFYDLGKKMFDRIKPLTPNKPPPQRQWIGLTEDEIKECFKITPDQFLSWQIYKKIEAKLKEKNA